MIDKQAKEYDDYDEIIAEDWAKNVHASPKILPSNNGIDTILTIFLKPLVLALRA